MVNGQSRKYQGSVFILAILTISLLSLLFLSMAQNARITTLFTGRSNRYYEMAIMKELFLAEYVAIPPAQRASSGEMFYSTGSVSYVYQAPYLRMTASTSDYQKKFEVVIEEVDGQDETEETVESKQIIRKNDTEDPRLIQKMQAPSLDENRTTNRK
ncbi:competence type IV pilus minor pilin ComGG [Enterococcus sp. DIV1314a]|uniref:competence type IV pilus minor pilin ComGG n=1 Tax=Enterococcus sp. DIV1314a TaxID=2774660 RepID=UPI003F244B9E